MTTIGQTLFDVAASVDPWRLERSLDDALLGKQLEALLLAALARVPSRPRIVRQAPGPWWNTRAGRVDVLLPDQRVVIEADSRRWHARHADFDRDRWRDKQAAAHDHRVLRFTWVHLHDLSDDVVELVDRVVRGSAAA